jgi:hypothetical protein
MIPEVVTLPLTDRSLPTVMAPSPAALVLTEGTSWLPLNMTFDSAAIDEPMPAPRAPAVLYGDCERES